MYFKAVTITKNDFHAGNASHKIVDLRYRDNQKCVTTCPVVDQALYPIS
jgi:hypothetical protein